jgi:hypothetical protein
MKMTYFVVLTAAVLIFSAAFLAWADTIAPNTPYHYDDMYGIYKVYDTPQNRDQDHHEKHHHEHPEIVYVNLAQPVVSSANGISDSDHRDLSAVDDRLHVLHLKLNEEQTNQSITADFYDEENRYLHQIERREDDFSNANGGYLSSAQESTLLDQLQKIETELNIAS